MKQIVKSNSSYTILFDYNPSIVDDIRRIPGRNWDALNKVWRVPESSLSFLRNFAQKHRFDIPGEAPDPFAKFSYSITPMPDLTQSIPLKMEMYPYQKQGTAYALEKKRLIIGDQPGLGKAQPLTANIATPQGWVKMGQLQVGQELFGVDGCAYKVEAIYPQGFRSVYKVTFNDGFSTECDIEHLWAVRDVNRRRRDQGWTVKTTRDLLSAGLEYNLPDKRKKSGRKAVLKWEIPLANPLQYPSKEYVIHPYIMGLLLGDGALSGRSICISIPDSEKETVAQVERILPSSLKLHVNRNPACPQYYITQTGTTKKNPYKAEVERLGLNVKGKYKFIPKEYLCGSISQRKLLLQGLMDADGSAKDNRITFHSCSEGLVKGVVELVQSLGGQAIVREYNRSHEGKSTEWQVNVRLGFCPFRIKRKAESWKKAKRNYASRYIQAIEFVDYKDVQCIRVSAPNHLYITDHCIVTHNTAQAIAAVTAANAFPCLVICPGSVKINWEREWKMWTNHKPMILADSVKRTWPYFYDSGLADVFIVNYESLKKYFVKEIRQEIDPKTGKPKKLTLKQITFNKEINLFKSVIVDESHRVKDTSTQQTKITKGVCNGKEYIFLLTGTPVVNKPKDLVSQLGIINQMQHFGGYQNFLKWFCDRANRWKELNVLLRNTCFYRREKQEVLKQLPSKVRQAVLCSISTQREYSEAMTNLEDYLKRYRQATDEQVQRSMRGEIMVKIGILKNISARGKLKDVIDYVSDVVDSGEKIVLFVHLREVADTLKKFFPAAVSILGQDDLLTRQRNIDAFQKDPSVQLIICSIKAAGVGITLTASSRVAFVELPWHPADCEQCEDRAHRIGQVDSVQCTYFLGKDTIDEWIYKLINEKRDMSRQITGANDEVEESIMNGVLNLLNKDK